MKRVLGLIVLGIAAGIAVAQEQGISEETLQKRVSEICKRYFTDLYLPANARERVLEGGLSPEWVTETLESIIRKNLPILEQIYKEGRMTWETEDGHSYLTSEYTAVLDRITSSILILGEVSGPNSLALLKESVSSIDYRVRYGAVHSYINIAGGDSVSFLQEIIAKRLDGNHRLAQNLRWRIIPDLKKKGRDSDVEKFHVFLLEQIQTEQDWLSVEQLDVALCATLDDYPQSIQRKQAIQRMQTSVKEWLRDDFNKIQADVDKTPADKRTDLSKRFKLAPAPQ